MVETASEGQGDRPLEGLMRALAEELDPSLIERGDLEVVGLAYDLLRLKPDVALKLDLSQMGGSASLGLSDDEFDPHRTSLVCPAPLVQFWVAHGPGELTPSGAEALALMEAEMPVVND